MQIIETTMQKFADIAEYEKNFCLAVQAQTSAMKNMREKMEKEFFTNINLKT